MSLKVGLLIIDPQNDFMDQPGAALSVPGAVADSKRLAAMIDRIGHKIDSITVTLDSHHLHHIAHPLMWVNEQGENPAPFTMITAADIAAGKWSAAHGSQDDWFEYYVQTLEADGKYKLVIWPPHCLIGSTGHAVQIDIFESLLRWERTRATQSLFVQKGMCNLTENYSAIRAEVTVSTDQTTYVNAKLLERLGENDMILVAGQALSHCVASTIRDMESFSNLAPKIHLLRDCTSNVGGFESLGDAFIDDLKAKGMKIVNSPELWP